MELAEAIDELHDRCAVYTSAPTACRLLDLIGWREDVDLSKSTLLEPCVGDGAILVEAVRRLVISVRRSGGAVQMGTLHARIRGFEFQREAAAKARLAVREELGRAGMRPASADRLAKTWVIERDFLLEPPGHATHVVANPPYVRWSKLPSLLAFKYRQVLPRAATRGDLAVAFLHRMQEWALRGGSIVAIVSDRWMYAQYGDDFVAETKGRGWNIDVIEERPDKPFVRKVGAYASIIALTSVGRGRPASDDRSKAREQHGRLLARYGSLVEAKCQVRVGPALGAGRTFILDTTDLAEVEPELIRPYVEKRDLKHGEVDQPKLRVIVPYTSEGHLIDLQAWPRFAAWAKERRAVLQRRSQFVQATSWWRTIDAVPALWSRDAKLLIPELTREMTVALDQTGSVPAHSIYAIWSDEWPIKVLGAVLNAGLLELTAKAEAPALTGGWVRFYKRFLVRTPLPSWPTLADQDREDLTAGGQRFENAFRRLFDFDPICRGDPNPEQ